MFFRLWVRAPRMRMAGASGGKFGGHGLVRGNRASYRPRPSLAPFAGYGLLCCRRMAAVPREAALLPCSAHRAGRHPPGAHAAAVGPAVRLHCGSRAPGSCRITRYALARCARTDAASQITKRADARRPWHCAPRRRTNRPCRVPPAASSWLGCWGPNTTSVAAKPVQGRPRCACAAPRSAAALAARAARFNNILGASVRAQRASAQRVTRKARDASTAGQSA